MKYSRNGTETNTGPGLKELWAESGLSDELADAVRREGWPLQEFMQQVDDKRSSLDIGIHFCLGRVIDLELTRDRVVFKKMI